MDIFNYTNFITADVEFQSTATSSFVKRVDSIELKLSGKTSGGSQYVRGKKKLTTEYKEGDDFWIYETLALPENFYSQQNGSMRLIGLWNHGASGRVALYIDNGSRPRLQTENKTGDLHALWTGAARQLPTGKHQYALHIILGSFTELFVDGVSMARVTGNNMPYAGYRANQILYFFDGANANTKPFTAFGYEIGADIKVPFAEVDPCADLEFNLSLAKVAREQKELIERQTLQVYDIAHLEADAARVAEWQAQSALDTCRAK